MRNELIDLYKLACANPQDKNIVRAYQSTRDRIGPQIAIHEAIDNDVLRARAARLEEALKEISTLYWFDAPAPEEMRRIARRALEETK